ncbi:hypothetical protein C8R45DRAFT_942808 [Mycena sanguinolenta]|nr:hypothetical protein C8R45DRAFT_942808 [Mycena sanguinolenta]
MLCVFSLRQYDKLRGTVPDEAPPALATEQNAPPREANSPPRSSPASNTCSSAALLRQPQEAEDPEPNAKQEHDAGVLVTGAHRKDHQLDGLHWMVGLHGQSISGILADQTSFRKIFQIIAFTFASTVHLRAACTARRLSTPLSVLHNWAKSSRARVRKPDAVVTIYSENDMHLAMPHEW